MVKMINTIFGNEMYVSENRVKEYLSAGHKLADSPKTTDEKPKAKKATTKKK